MDNQYSRILDKFYRLHKLVHLYKSAARGRGNPHQGQGRVLAILKMQESVSQKQLAFLLGMRQQSISELLIKLEKKELITRRPSEEDRRVTLVSLTEKGRQEAPDPEGDGDEDSLAKLFAGLTRDELDELERLLDRAGQSAEKAVGELPERPDRHGGHGPEASGHGRPFGHRGDGGADPHGSGRGHGGPGRPERPGRPDGRGRGRFDGPMEPWPPREQDGGGE